MSCAVVSLQENADLKRQLACMQQVAQQQKATIVLLQQEMVKILSCLRVQGKFIHS